MPKSSLASVLTKIRERISKGAYPHETAVRNQIVRPILNELGWDVDDPQKVYDEYPLKLETTTRRIDVALCVAPGKLRCIIELKATNYDLKQIGKSDGDRQLFQYLFHAGAPIALLTNGIDWRFYSPFSAGTYEERLVRTLDIQKQTAEEVAANLERYLSYANTESGRAAHNAKDDLDRRIGQVKARDAIPRVWANLVESDADDRLVALVATATSALADSEPARADVIEFLRRLRPDDSGAQRRSKRSRRPGSKEPVSSAGGTPAPQEPAPQPQPKPVLPVDTRGVRYRLREEERLAKHAADAFVELFSTLAKQDETFLSRVEPKVRGRKRHLVAREKLDLGADKTVQTAARPLPRGWWIHCHLSNKDKIRYLKIACDVAGIPFGNSAGLEIDLPNT